MLVRADYLIVGSSILTAVENVLRAPVRISDRVSQDLLRVALVFTVLNDVVLALMRVDVDD